MNSEKVKLAGILLLVTVLLCPWRDFATQDDGAYAYSAISFSNGSTLRHAGTIALNFFQFATGTAALKILPGLPPLSVLNFLSWVFFVCGAYLFLAWTRIPWTIVFSYFAFPVWVQFGSCYHGEVYSGFLLILLLGFLLNADKFPNAAGGFLGFVLSFLVGTQLQNMAAFPLLWGAFLLLEKDNKKRLLGLSLIAGSCASVLLFAFMPKTPFQSAYAYWLTQMWLMKGSLLPFHYLVHMLQMFAAIGLYLFPLFCYKDRPKRSWIMAALLHLAVFTIIDLSGIAVMAGGVLFLEYLPRRLTIALLSAGVWGWWGAWPVISKAFYDKTSRDRVPVYGTMAAFVVVWIFSTFRFALDIRYMMTWSIPILYHCRAELRERKHLLGKQPVFVLAALVITVFMNLYLMNTTAARWSTAADLEAQGATKKEIAAGYGYNIFMIGSECMYNTVDKLVKDHGENVWKEQIFYDRFISRYGWVYEDGWVPRFVIKPSKIFGYPIYLKRGRLPGQDSDPVKFIDYSVLGIPNQLAVYQNSNPKIAWCFE
jgi:hypothetical protein